MTESERPQLWEFWERTKRELAQTALEPRQEHLPEHSTAHLLAYRVSSASLGGVRGSGYYTHPMRNGEVRLPGLVTFPGYGGAVSLPLEEAARGYACLALDPRGQGQSAQAYPMERGKLTHRPQDLWSCGLRGAYADALRGLDFLQTRPEVEGGRLGVVGTSGGGGLTLACASIDDRPLVAAAHVPFGCRLVWAAQNVPTHPYRWGGRLARQMMYLAAGTAAPPGRGIPGAASRVPRSHPRQLPLLPPSRATKSRSPASVDEGVARWSWWSSWNAR
jgi:cephalosporin-C deacetylase-like acetyl esterase